METPQSAWRWIDSRTWERPAYGTLRFCQNPQRPDLWESELRFSPLGEIVPITVLGDQEGTTERLVEGYNRLEAQFDELTLQLTKSLNQLLPIVHRDPLSQVQLIRITVATAFSAELDVFELWYAADFNPRNMIVESVVYSASDGWSVAGLAGDKESMLASHPWKPPKDKAELAAQLPDPPPWLSVDPDRLGPEGGTQPVDHRGCLRAVLRLIVWLAVILGPLIAIVAYQRAEDRQAARFSGDRSAQAKIRQAQNFLSMWRGAVDPARPPMMTPAEIEVQLADVARAERVREETREQVRSLLAEIPDNRWYRLCNRIEEVNLLLENLAAWQWPDPWVDQPWPRATVGKVVVITAPDSPPTPAQPARWILEGHLNEACGELLATSAAEIEAILAVQWSRIAVGESTTRLRMRVRNEDRLDEEALLGSATVGDPQTAYEYRCDIALIDRATGRTLGSIRLVGRDPEQRDVIVDVPGPPAFQRAPGGAQTARDELMELLRGLPGGQVAPRTSRPDQ